MVSLSKQEPLLSIPISDEAIGYNPMVWSSDNRFVLLGKEGAAIFELNITFPNMEQGFDMTQGLILHPNSRQPDLSVGRSKFEDRSSLFNNMRCQQFWFSKAIWSEPGTASGMDILLCLITPLGEALVYEKRGRWQLKWNINTLYEENCNSQMNGNSGKLQIDVAVWLPPHQGTTETLSYLLLLTRDNRIVVNSVTSELHSSRLSMQISFDADLVKSPGIFQCAEILNISSDTGLLCTAKSNGRIDLYHWNTTKRTIDFVGAIAEASPMMLSHLCFQSWNKVEGLFVVVGALSGYVKAFLFSMTKDCVEIKDEAAIPVSSFNITGFSMVGAGTIYASTKHGLLEKVTFNVFENRIVLSKENLIKQENNRGFNGLVLSPNRCLLAILETLMTQYDHLDIREPNTIQIYSTESKSALIAACKLHQDFDLSRCDDIYETIRVISQNDRYFGELAGFHPLVQMRLLKCLPLCANTSEQIEELERNAKTEWANEMLAHLDLTENTIPELENIKVMLESLYQGSEHPLEKCPVCGDVVPRIQDRECVRKHCLSRCTKTNLIIDVDDEFYECKGCSQCYHTSIAAVGDSTCLFCTKPLAIFPNCDKLP